MKLSTCVALWLLTLALIALLAGCATDPRTGRQVIDFATTARVLGAISGSLLSIADEKTEQRYPRESEPGAGSAGGAGCDPQWDGRP